MIKMGVIASLHLRKEESYNFYHACHCSKCLLYYYDNTLLENFL